MAKRGRPAKAMAGEGGKRVISVNVFAKLMKDIKSAEADKNEAVGSIGGLISTAVEKHNVNKKALSWYRAAERMSGPKLRDVLEQFTHYCQIGGLVDKATEQAEMYSSDERGTTRSNGNGSFASELEQKRAEKRRMRNPKLTKKQIEAAADRAEASEELH